ncbi:MAG: T9SS type A sorting domain-containing protein [Bacteroidota bacterium]
MQTYTIKNAYLLLLLLLVACQIESTAPVKEKQPHDYFFRQRAYPNGQIDHQAYRTALEYRAVQQNSRLESRANEEAWTLAGPTNTGGRISDLEVAPSDENIIYIGAASGGIFKTSDGGSNWQPIFEDALSLSIGDIALAPSNEQTIYVGTGEPNAGGGSLAYDGMGVYKSKDAGASWTHLGLEAVGSIGKVVVSPKDEAVVYVAAMGHLFGNNPERGVYRTTDGGENWEQILYVSDSTGAIDLAIHPDRPEIIYAATWERIRRVNYRQYGGATSGIYRSVNGGDNWEELTAGLPSDPDAKGRIGIAIAPSDPEVLYASYVRSDNARLQGIYRTTNGGDTWQSRSKSGITDVPYMWWFGNLFVDPTDEDLIYYLGFNTHKSTNGGGSWQPTFVGVHVDQHALAFSSNDPSKVFLANDGGLYSSNAGGSFPSKIENLPITQFYTCEIDATQPERLYGGTQDNGTIRTTTGALNDWRMIYGGDGFRVLVDPNDNRYVYAESQYGGLGRSTNGGSSFRSARDGIAQGDRKNWNSPLIFDPNDSETLYFGTQRVYRSNNRAERWIAISPDLSDGGGNGNLVYGTITSLAASALEVGVVYAGTDDGNVWITRDGGTNWTKINNGIPKRWITSILVDPNLEGQAYVTVSGFRYNSDLAHVFKTEDYGATWIDISSNLPDVPVNDIVKYPLTDQLFLATDIGVFASNNEGASWDLLAKNLPNVPIIDLDVEADADLLVAATYGRSLYRYDLKNATTTRQISAADMQLRISPNPIVENAIVSFVLNQRSSVELLIFNAKGELVRQVEQARLDKGEHQIPLAFDLASGSYWLSLRTAKGQISTAFVIL